MCNVSTFQIIIVRNTKYQNITINPKPRNDFEQDRFCRLLKTKVPKMAQSKTGGKNSSDDWVALLQLRRN